jgi:hypothetical protein
MQAVLHGSNFQFCSFQHTGGKEWQMMYQSIVTCQRVNNRLGRAKAELHPIPVTDVWKRIGIDLIGMFQMIWMIV